MFLEAVEGGAGGFFVVALPLPAAPAPAPAPAALSLSSVAGADEEDEDEDEEDDDEAAAEDGGGVSGMSVTDAIAPTPRGLRRARPAVEGGRGKRKAQGLGTEARGHRNVAAARGQREASRVRRNS